VLLFLKDIVYTLSSGLSISLHYSPPFPFLLLSYTLVINRQ